jgi:predicted chitinase
MRSREFISEEQVDERLAKTLAALGLVGAAAFGGNKIHDYFSTPAQEPEIKAISGKIKDLDSKNIAGTAKPKAATKYQVPTNVSGNEKLLADAAAKAGIRGLELVQFMAQTAHESANFTKLKEVGSKEYLTKRYDKKYSPERAKILGNIKPGDGIKFKGRGFIQLTGRYNYSLVEKSLGFPLTKNPQLAADPEVAAEIAVWYWKNRVRPKVTDWSDVESVTKPINANLRGLEDRQNKFQQFEKKYRSI